MSNIIFLFQKLLIKQNHKTDSFFCVQYLYHDDIPIYQFLIENIKSIFLSDFGQKDTSIISWFKNIKKTCVDPNCLSSQSFPSHWVKIYINICNLNLKLIIKVKAKTPDMNIDKITKHKMDAK